MNKQKFSRIMMILGLGFVIWLIGSYMMHIQNRAEILTSQIKVPAKFATQFSRVITKHKAEPIPSTPFMSPQNKQTDWSDFKGEYLLVNFWATWCAPCVVELPSLNDLQERFAGKGLNVIAISLDTMRPHDDIKAFLENRAIGDFAAYFDHAQNIQKNFRMRGIPTSYLIDPKGNIAYIFEGDADWDSPAAVKFMEKLLNLTNA